MKLVPFAVIQEVKKFDTEAVEFVFRHFAGFIASKCQRHYTDEYGCLTIRNPMRPTRQYKALTAWIGML